MSSSSNPPYWYHGSASQPSQEEVNLDSNSDMPFNWNSRERRYTTITLREIRYPLGCPCHPEEPKATKKKQQPRAPSPDSRPATYLYHSRPELTPRTESQDSTNSTDSTNSQTSRSRSFSNFLRRVSAT